VPPPACGAEVYPARLPIHADAGAPLGKRRHPGGPSRPRRWEDYELLFAVDTEAIPQVINLTDVPLRAIGQITAGNELVLVD